jgi:hypothetical protein
MSAKIIALHDRDRLRAMAEAIAAEFDPATLPEGDVGLIEGMRRIREIEEREEALCEQFESLVPDLAEILRPTTWAAEEHLCDVLNNREPQTLAGAVAKLQFLREVIRHDWDGFIVDNEVTALRQVIALLEREPSKP